MGLVYIEYPIMLILIVAGLDKMDIYHIVLLIFFVVYALSEGRYTKFTLFLLFYSDFFLLEKYVYTLFIQ